MAAARRAAGGSERRFDWAAALLLLSLIITGWFGLAGLGLQRTVLKPLLSDLTARLELPAICAAACSGAGETGGNGAAAQHRPGHRPAGARGCAQRGLAGGAVKRGGRRHRSFYPRRKPRAAYRRGLKGTPGRV